MVSQKAKGKGQLVARLTAQTGSRNMAVGLLKKRGMMTADGKLTAKGRARNNMTAGQRAKDRAAKASGHKKSEYTYKASTNTAVLKRKKK